MAEPFSMLTKPAAAVEELQHVGDSLVAAGGAVLLDGLPPAVTVRALNGMAVLGLEAEEATARANFSLGKLKAQRFLALGRTSLWWMAPARGTSTHQVPEETQFLLCELEGGAGYGLVLPLISEGAFRATLRPASPTDAGQLAARLESGNPAVTASRWAGAVLAAAGRDPFALMERGVAAAARLSGTAKHRSEKEVPPAADVFGFCTWDAFYSRVSAAGIQAGLKSLAEGGAPPRLLIIDDGWQRTDTDPEFRAAGASAEGCMHSADGGSLGMGSSVHAVEEAVAALVSDPPDHLDQNLKALHRIQSEEPADGSAAQAPAGGSPAVQGSGGALGLLAAWAQAAFSAVAGVVAGLETAFFNFCRRVLETTPASSRRMRLFSALATSRLLRGPLLRYFAAVSDHTRRLVSIKANAKFSSPSAGPEHALNSCGEDLAGVVAQLKRDYGLRYVFAWHAMAGFWGGLGLEEEEMQKYKPRLVMPTPTPGVAAVDPSVAWVQPVLSGVGLPADPRPLHEDMHAYLAACGVDGVKVDVQSTIGLLGSGAGMGGGPATAAAYHASLEVSAAKHFPGNQLINCMCHSTEDLYSMTRTNLARVSDDFYPLNSASWLTHISTCSYNSLFMGEVVVPDWDMFHSLHPKALLHATARAVSGGPVYVSDRPGRHDFALLRRLVLPDGAVLRCALPGRPTADCLFTDVSRDGQTALKVWNVNACSGVVAVFNVQGSAFSRRLRRFDTHDDAPPTLAATVSSADVPPLSAAASTSFPDGGAADTFAAYVDSTQQLALLAAGQGLPVTVAGGGGCDVVTLAPVRSLGGVAFAPLGLTGMLNPGGAVLSCSMAGGHSDGGFEVQPARASLQLRGAGAVLAYASHRPCSVAVGGQELAFEYDEAAGALRFELPPGEAASTPKACAIQF